LPLLLPSSALKRFFQVIQNCGDVQHEILLKAAYEKFARGKLLLLQNEYLAGRVEDGREY
jgi:hypothetical protein